MNESTVTKEDIRLLRDEIRDTKRVLGGQIKTLDQKLVARTKLVKRMFVGGGMLKLLGAYLRSKRRRRRKPS